MNNRQAGAFRELIRREERTRELWHASMNARTGNQNGAVVDGTIGGNGAILPPLQTRGGILPVADSQPVANTAYLPADNMAPIDPHGIYQRAIRIGSPHLIDEQDRGIEDAAVRTQRVVRQVELPVSREVKVPVNTRQIVQTTVPRRVRTTRLVEVPSFKTVSQPYTAVEERPAVRHREIWVKKLVPERYMQRVEVQKSRNIRVPTTEVKEVADYAIVQVPAHTTVDVPGYRVDTVEDSKLVEVEEHVPMEMRPVAAGRAQVVGHRDIGPLGLNRSRQIGAEVYHHQDPSIAHVELDNAPVDPASRGITRPYSAATRSLGRSNTQPRGAITSRSIPLAATAPFDNANYDASPATDGNLSIGFRVRDAAGSRSVEAGGQQGCLVFKVHSGEPAQRAGLQVGDMVTHVNNKPTRNIAEFRSVINNSTGPMLVRVKRRGGFSLALTIHR